MFAKSGTFRKFRSGVKSYYELKLIAIWGGSQIKDVRYRPPPKKKTNKRNMSKHALYSTHCDIKIVNSKYK